MNEIKVCQCEACGMVFDPSTPEARALGHSVTETEPDRNGNPCPVEAQCGPITERILADPAEVRRETIEECAQICLRKIHREAGYQGQWEGYGGWDGDMDGPECAAAIRSLLDKEADDE